MPSLSSRQNATICVLLTLSCFRCIAILLIANVSAAVLAIEIFRPWNFPTAKTWFPSSYKTGPVAHPGAGFSGALFTEAHEEKKVAAKITVTTTNKFNFFIFHLF